MKIPWQIFHIICISIFKLEMPITMLSKLKYAGVHKEDLVDIYNLFIRSKAEYCSVVFHHSLTEQQTRKLEAIQRVSLKIILGSEYESYDSALEATGLETLAQRRENRCLDFGLKAAKHEVNKRMFPLNPNPNIHDVREVEKYVVNFARHEHYRKSAIPSIQRMLNFHHGVHI